MNTMSRDTNTHCTDPVRIFLIYIFTYTYFNTKQKLAKFYQFTNIRPFSIFKNTYTKLNFAYIL